MVDVISTAALITLSDHPGVSADLSVSFMSPGPGSEEVTAEAEVLKVGKSLAFMEVTIRTVRDGRLVAKGSHTKFLPGSKKGKRDEPRSKL
jgi:acyl-coenzyme A thioesterase 13